MGNKILKYLKILIKTILTNYPEIKINYKKIEDDYYIIINNKKIFNSEDFKEFLMKLYIDYIWKNNLNILFTYNENKTEKFLITTTSIILAKPLFFNFSIKQKNNYDLSNHESPDLFDITNDNRRKLYIPIINSVDYENNENFKTENLALAA